MISVDREKCLHCRECINDCPVQILTLDSDGTPALTNELEKFCIKCQHCLAICPSGALSFNGISPETCAVPGELPSPDAMLGLIKMRRSVRRYKDENIPQEVMEKLKSSLNWSATGCNDHRLFFYVAESKDDMEFFRAETTRMLKLLVSSGIMRLFYPNIQRFLDKINSGVDVIYRGAPHMIIAATPKNAPCKNADPWIALSNFDLLLQSYGLGSCWCGFAERALKWNRKLRKHIQLPKGYQIGAVLLFGTPDVKYFRATVPEPCIFAEKNK